MKSKCKVVVELDGRSQGGALPGALVQGSFNFAKIRGAPFVRCCMAGLDGGEYVTADEACDILGVTGWTLDRYADTGRIRKYRRGIRNVVFRRVDAERLKRELEEVRPINDDE